MGTTRKLRLFFRPKTQKCIREGIQVHENTKILKETSTPPPTTEMRSSLLFQSKIWQNRIPTLGENRQKSKRFARDVLQFGAFCNTSREITRFCIFATPLGPECKTARRGPSKLQKMLGFSTKCPIHPFQKTEHGIVRLKQLSKNRARTPFF